jgi:hypothetical protein
MDEFPIIDKLGGRKLVAILLGVKPNAVRMWTRRGSIPGPRQVALWDEAIRRGIHTTPDDFKATPNSKAA